MADVTIVEVAPRDGLQNHDRALNTTQKIAFIEALAAAGAPVIEATSFVSPSAVPLMADAGEVMVDGNVVAIANPAAATDLGMNFIHQELAFIPGMTVLENIMLGLPKKSRFGMVDWKAVAKDVEPVARRVEGEQLPDLATHFEHLEPAPGDRPTVPHRHGRCGVQSCPAKPEPFGPVAHPAGHPSAVRRLWMSVAAMAASPSATLIWFRPRTRSPAA